MEASILNSVKEMLGGISQDNSDFDISLILFINSVLADLYTLGGITELVEINDATDTWDQLNAKPTTMGFIKPFVFLKVKMLFDPPTGGAKEALDNVLSEYEWRIQIAQQSDIF